MLLEGLPLLVDIISLPDKLVPRSTTLTYEFSRLRSRLAKPLIFLPFFNNKRNHPPCFEFFTNILCNTSYVICEYQCYIQGVLNFNVKVEDGQIKQWTAEFSFKSAWRAAQLKSSNDEYIRRTQSGCSYHKFYIFIRRKMNDSSLRKLLLLKTYKLVKSNKLKHTNNWKIINNLIRKKQYIIDTPKTLIK